MDPSFSRRYLLKSRRSEIKQREIYPKRLTPSTTVALERLNHNKYFMIFRRGNANL